jgi:hypothetical protein
MNYEKYPDVIVNSDFLQYEFISIGPKGEVKKCIQFTETNNPSIFNLAFGNLLNDGSINDLTIDNNLDRNKILATVVSTVYEFCSFYPEKWVFFNGSTIGRTRLYRMAITINLEELSNDFDILGVLKNWDGEFVNVPFKKETNYFGFLVKLKNT